MSKDMLGIAMRKLVALPANVLGVVCDLLDKLTDPEWVKATKKFLRKENPWIIPWEWHSQRKVRVGTDLRTADDFRRALTGKNWSFDGEANELLNRAVFNVSDEELAFFIVITDPEKLGFERSRSDEVRRTDVLNRALERGLTLCTPEIVLQFCLRHESWFLGDSESYGWDQWLDFAMESIPNEFGNPHHFVARSTDDEGELMLLSEDSAGFVPMCSAIAFVRKD